MSKTRAEIDMDYNGAKVQADKLNEVAASVRRIADDQLEVSFQDISKSWQSDAAGRYGIKGGLLLDEVRKEADRLAELAEGIKTMADTVYRAELENIETAQNRQ
ncbi:MAG: hypothetical protein EOM40_05305 [Clostridia bacterium]|nr:hypothetical protein [Clostridia bacterium]NCC44114.1 hypothetical protein [Clostridia bacterium]